MKKTVTLLNKLYQPVQVLTPALFSVSSEFEYQFERKLEKDSSKEKKVKNPNVVSLYQNANGGFVLYQQSQEGSYLGREKQLADITFPLSLFKDERFVQYLIEQNAAHTPQHVLVVDGDKPVSCVEKIESQRFISNGKLIKRYFKRINDKRCYALVIDFKNKAALVTNYGTGDEDVYQTLWHDKGNSKPFDIDKDIPESWEMFELFIREEDKTDVEVTHIECYIDINDTQSIKPIKIALHHSPTKRKDLLIYGEIIAEHYFDIASAEDAKRCGFNTIKVICYHNNSGVGIGFIAVTNDFNSKDLYLKHEAIRLIKQDSFECQAQEHIKQAFAHAQKQLLIAQGIQDPESYIGILTAEPLQEQEYIELFGKKIYGKEVFCSNNNDVSMIKFMQQNGKVMVYDIFDPSESIHNVRNPRLITMLNEMALSPIEKEAEHGQFLIQYLLEHRVVSF